MFAGVNPWFEVQSLTVSGSLGLGASVAQDADYVIAGAPSTQNNRGMVQVWERATVNTYAEVGSALGLDEGDRLGKAVAIDGSERRALAGAPNRATSAGANAGAVYALEEGPVSGWLIDQVIASDVVTSSNLGSAVAMSGDLALAGAPQDVVGPIRAGTVLQMFHTGGSWVVEDEWTGKDHNIRDELGYAVAIDGNFAVVGAPGDADLAFDCGGAYVFERSGNEWNLVDKFTPGLSASAFDEFGSSVAISGTRALVGAPSDEHANGTQSGAAYTFSRQLTGTWSSGLKIQPNDPEGGARFGASVAIDGTALVVGAPEDGATGAVYVFRQGFGISLEQKITLQNPQVGETFGASVHVDGDLLAIGAPLFDFNGTQNCGRALLYEHAGGSWSLVGVFSDAPLVNGGDFGRSVAVSGSRFAVGAPGANFGRGHVMVFEEVLDWEFDSLVEDPDASVDDRYGHSVDLDGDILVVGAPSHPGVGPDSGGDVRPPPRRLRLVADEARAHEPGPGRPARDVRRRERHDRHRRRARVRPRGDRRGAGLHPRDPRERAVPPDPRR